MSRTKIQLKGKMKIEDMFLMKADNKEGINTTLNPALAILAGKNRHINFGVHKRPDGPAIVSAEITAQPQTLHKGQTALLSWSSKNAQTITIDNWIGEVPGSGTLKIHPDKTTTFNIVATSRNGAETSSFVTVEVIKDPSAKGKTLANLQQLEDCTELIEKMKQKIRGKTAFIAALFVASLFVLGLKLLNPTPIQIVIEGENASITQIPGFFTLEDVIIIVVVSIILGVSGMYLLFFDSVEKPAGELVLGERKKRWKEIAKTLKEDEQKIYRAIIEADGIIEQSELSEKTGISKAGVSRALDLLESKGLVERRRRGMRNTILLK